MDFYLFNCRSFRNSIDSLADHLHYMGFLQNLLGSQISYGLEFLFYLFIIIIIFFLVQVLCLVCWVSTRGLCILFLC